MTGAEELYAKAYGAHYKEKDYKTALNVYLRVVKYYPWEDEAKYARQQIENLLNIPQLVLKVDADVEDTFEALSLEKKQQEASKREAAEKQEAVWMSKQECEAKLRDMVLTTCPSVEGYSITKQCGLVFGEIVFKTGFFKSLAASFNNLADILTAGDQELSGTSKLLNDARACAIDKMKREALERKANAVIGIDTESSFGGDLIHITIMGTAVYIEKSDASADE